MMWTWGDLKGRRGFFNRTEGVVVILSMFDIKFPPFFGEVNMVVAQILAIFNSLKRTKNHICIYIII